jgi:hypothetical protein
VSAGVCIVCAELFEGSARGGCPRCGKRLARGRTEILAWETARQEARIAAWRRDGVIDDEIANRLRARVALDVDAKANANAKENEDENAAEKAKASAVERGADVVVSGAGNLYTEMAARWKRLAENVERDARPNLQHPNEANEAHDEASLQHDDRTLEAGRAIFARDGRGAVVGAGIEALSALDDDEPAHGERDAAAHGDALKEATKPFGALQVFWFIGTLLVLAGSVMGVREAWRTLEGVWRPVVIAGAFFAYHVLFVGLARLLVRRSAVTGRVLAGIAAGLLPVVFVAAAVSIGQQSSIGVPFAAMLLLASTFTLVLVGRIADRATTGMALAAGLVPSLVLELALGTGGASPSRRAVVVLVALLPVAVAATRARVSASTSTIVTLAASTYGAIAVGILGLYGGPGDPSLPFDDGGIGQRALMAWLAASAAVGWWASSGPGVAARFAKVASVPLVVSLAVLVSTSAAALVLGLTQNAASLSATALGAAIHVPLAVLVLAAVVLVVEQRTRPGALHAAVLVSLGMMVLVGKAVVPDRPELWPSTCAAVPASFLFFGAFVGDRRRRAILATWGVLAAIGTLLTVLGVEAVTRTSANEGTPWKTSALTAAVLALSAHVGARTSRPSLHLAGALFAFVAMATWLLPTSAPLLDGSAIGDPWAHTLMLGCAGLATAYGLAALGYATIAPKDDDRRPLDDASLFLATGAVWLGVLFATRAPLLVQPFGMTDLPAAKRIWLAAPSLALTLVLLARSVRDRSALVTAQAAVALALAVYVATGAGSDGASPASVCLAGLLAASFAVIASARVPRASGSPQFGRAIYGVVPLPFAGGPRTVLDGFALVALALVGLALLPVLGWLGAPMKSELSRTFYLFGLAGVLCVAVAAFATRAFERLHARGNVATLWIAAPVIGLTVVAYRIGRPLPPDAVGFRLSIVIVVVWLLARGIVKIGPRMGRALDRPEDGAHYHHVAHFGVLALALLLFVDAVLVGGPTPTRSLAVVPPLLLAGSAVGVLLLYRSYGREPLLHVGLLLASLASLLGFAQRALLGPALVPLEPPGGRWVPALTAEAARVDWLDPALFLGAGDTELALWNRGWLGVAVAAAALGALLVAFTRSAAVAHAVRATIFAREEHEVPAIERAIAVPLAILAAALALGLAFQPSIPAAIAFAVAGALAAAALSPAYRAAPLVLAAPLLVHAFAQSAAVIPTWAGPAIALLGLAIVLVGRRVSASRGHDPNVVGATQLVALAYAPLSLAYALAAGGVTSAVAAAPSVGALATRALDTQWVVTYAPALTLAIVASTWAAAGLAWRGNLAKLLLVAPPIVLAVAGAWLTAAFTSGTTVTAGLAIDMVVRFEGAFFALALAVAATVAHLAALASSRARRNDAVDGLSIGRDVALVASTLVMCAYVALRDDSAPGGFMEGPCGVGALGLLIAVSLHAVAWQGTARHVALVEGLLVAFYAFTTRSFRFRPEVDALIGLLYGFSLLGVAVVARRRKIPAVADATRRFAAVLPIALMILTTRGATNQAAGLALGISVLYGAMAWVERSRIFGSLAALAANLALVVFAVAQGLDGAEVFIGPAGIFVTVLAQIFAPRMTPAARSALRIVGGALLYLPAGLKLTFRLGAAEDGGRYAVIFGVVCLLGVVAGLVLRVRAYLALGTMFLTLDVVANLVHAGLRDHRVGFLLLSVSGLAILGTMIGITLRRDATWGIVGRFRLRLRAWD